jgi:hypothetical protein
LPRLERARVIEAVKRLYLDRLRVGNTVSHEAVAPQAGELLLTQAIADAVDRAFAENPDRASEFVRKLDRFQRTLARLRLTDEVVGHFPQPGKMVGPILGRSAVAIIGAPLALYGWVHRLIPYAVVNWSVRHLARKPPDKTQISTVTIISGLVAFSAFYAFCVLVFHYFFGWRATVWYAVTLPVASLAAHYYLRRLRQLAPSVRAAAVLLRAPSAARKLQAARTELIALIEAARKDLTLVPPGAPENAKNLDSSETG